MGDYTRMSAYYDLIMTSGYYDYDAIVTALDPGPDVRTVLELGAGTGLVIERLVARRPDLDVTGIDLTQAMLDIAVDRLAPHPQVSLHQEDVCTLSLGRRYDVAFSYGGVWYFIPDGDDFAMISHIRNDDANAEGLRRVAEHVVTGGRLLLGVQGPHSDYSSPVNGGLRYSQRISPLEGGFRKYYRLDAGDVADSGDTEPLMEQTTDYRVYDQQDALDLLDKAGFTPRPRLLGHGGPDGATPLFLEFERR